jgi:hypothetical protein
MDPKYLLQQLFNKVAALRKAQKDYYAHRAPKEDPLKRGYLQEAQRREQDVDKLLVQIRTALPELSIEAGTRP